MILQPKKIYDQKNFDNFFVKPVFEEMILHNKKFSNKNF